MIMLTSAAAMLFLSQVAAPSSTGSTLRQMDERVATVAYRLATQARRLCPEPRPIAGLLFHHLADYQAKDRPGMIARHRLDRGLGVLTVVAGSPAARAGIIAGDIIITVGNIPVMSAPPGSDRAARDAIEDRFEDLVRTARTVLRVERNGQQVEITLEPEQGCPSRVRLARSNDVKGVANARHVVLTTALLAELTNDDELAIVIGHELAHVALRHPERLIAQGVPRGLLRGFGENAERVHETEEEADRLGIKLAWAAGFDIRAAIPFWRRFYAKYDGPQLFRTHPSLARRERLVAETLAELEAGPERPELREGALRQR